MISMFSREKHRVKNCLRRYSIARALAFWFILSLGIFSYFYFVNPGLGCFENYSSGALSLRESACYEYTNYKYDSEHKACTLSVSTSKVVACVSLHPEWASYTMRCRHLVPWLQKYGRRDCRGVSEFIIVLKSFPQIRREKTNYFATIVVKSEIPTDFVASAQGEKLGHVLEDVVDGRFNGSVGTDIIQHFVTVIVQNEFQQEVWMRTHRTVIIEHAPTTILEAQDAVSLKMGNILSVVSVQQTHGKCMKLPKSILFEYECIITYNTQETTGSLDLFVGKLGPGSRMNLTLEYLDLLSRPDCLWGTGWLFTKFFQQFDVVVVYTKPGRKAKMNSVQRMTNAMSSGVVTVVQRTGVHELYVPSNYTCAFGSKASSLYNLLEHLAENPGMRRKCLIEANEIIDNKKLSVPAIIAKYEKVLRSVDL